MAKKSKLNAMFEDVMHTEIEKRKNDYRWSREIAGRVMARHKKKKRLYLSAGMSSIAAAAVVLAVVTTGIDRSQSAPGYADMINTQTRGIYLSVFDSRDAAGDYDTYSTDTMMSEDIDAIIDESLMMR